jgi:hypothetical protein
MHDMQKHLKRLLRDASECQLVSDLATDKSKRELFARLTEHHRTLASEVQRAIDQQSNNAAVNPIAGCFLRPIPDVGTGIRFSAYIARKIGRQAMTVRNRVRLPGSLRDRLLAMAKLARQKAEACSDSQVKELLMRKADQSERTAAVAGRQRHRASRQLIASSMSFLKGGALV